MGSPARPQGLSIVIPVYFSGATIERALRSVTNGLESVGEAKLRAEVLLVFDGPDEESLAAVLEFQATSMASIRVFHKDHSGIAGSRNIGLREAVYSHVTFLDSDDEMTLPRLRAVTHWPDDVVIGRQEVIWDSISPPPGGVPDPRTSDGLPNPYLTSLVAPTDTLLKLGGFREDLVLSDDLDLVMRLRKSGHQLIFDSAVFAKRHITGNNSSLDYASLKREFFQLLRDGRTAPPDELRGGEQ
jgi:glycosyltransferase involved in cell wall biosynthesis